MSLYRPNPDGSCCGHTVSHRCPGCPYGVLGDGEAWEQAARDVLKNPRAIEEIQRDIAKVRERIAGVKGLEEGQQ